MASVWQDSAYPIICFIFMQPLRLNLYNLSEKLYLLIMKIKPVRLITGNFSPQMVPPNLNMCLHNNYVN